MSDKFKAMFEEAREAGLPDEWITKFESSFEASPLREENKSLKDRMKETYESNTKLRDTLLATKFSSHGVTISPSALRIPDDLDVTDDEKVEGWLVQAGLTSAKPTTDPSIRATHDRIANASNEETNATAAALSELDPTTLSEDEFYAKAEAIMAKIQPQ